MYVYLYDNFLRKKKYASVIKAVEIKLTDYGIAGKVLRLNNYIDTRTIIEDEIKRGAKTIVIVGNDATFGQVLSRNADSNCVFGFIPIGSADNTIAEVLGIPIGSDACDILSKRRKEKLDVGWVNNRFFISQLLVKHAKVRIFYDDQFSITTKGRTDLVVCNLQPFFWKRNKKDKKHLMVHPQDGKLEAFVRPLTKKGLWGYKYEEPSIFPFEEMNIEGKEAFIMMADGKTTKEKKVKIRLARNKVDMIVGRNRKF